MSPHEFEDSLWKLAHAESFGDVYAIMASCLKREPTEAQAYLLGQARSETSRRLDARCQAVLLTPDANGLSPPRPAPLPPPRPSP